MKTAPAMPGGDQITIVTPASWVTTGYPVVIELEVSGYPEEPVAVLQKKTNGTVVETLDTSNGLFHDPAIGIIRWEVKNPPPEPAQDYLWTIVP
jgi:hypothetical protein